MSNLWRGVDKVLKPGRGGQSWSGQAEVEVGEGGGERVGVLVGGKRVWDVNVLRPGLALELVGLEGADVWGGRGSRSVCQRGERRGRGLLTVGFRLILKETSKNKTCLVPGPVPCIVEVKRCRERTLQRESWLSVSREGEGGESLGGLHSSPI